MNIKYLFPFYPQFDMMDCGPACLRMIAKYYGKYFTLQTLRKKCFITHEGVSMLGISEAAESIGFRSLGVRLDTDRLVENNIFICMCGNCYLLSSAFIIVRARLKPLFAFRFLEFYP